VVVVVVGLCVVMEKEEETKHWKNAGETQGSLIASGGDLPLTLLRCSFDADCFSRLL